MNTYLSFMLFKIISFDTVVLYIAFRQIKAYNLSDLSCNLYMSREKVPQNKQLKKTLGLSTKTLNLRLSKKQLTSSTINKPKDTVVIITKTKSSQPLSIKDIKKGNLTIEEKQNRFKAIIDAEKVKIPHQVDYQFDKVKSKSDVVSSNTQKKFAISSKHFDDNNQEEKSHFLTKTKNLNRPHAKNNNTQNIKKKLSKLKNDKVDLHDKKEKKIRDNISGKRELKNPSLTQIYNLEKEDKITETKIKTTQIQSRSKHKDLTSVKKNKLYREVIINNDITVQELAGKMTEKVSLVINTLMTLGINTTSSERIDPDTAELIVHELGHKAIRTSDEERKKSLIDTVEDSVDNLRPRPPIVAVMGHVDHGKTSLLDALRLTNVVQGEHGGITQHIGAYTSFLSKGKSITFLDTPGHSAFTAMRMRGAKITDIVIIVIAAEDGIKDQTIEAINHAKAASVPVIVAVNKIDKPNANFKKVKHSLLSHNLIPDDMGGETIVVPISVKAKVGLDDLQEAIIMQSEILNLRANPDRKAEGVVIESKLDKLKGVLITLIIQKGTLRVGDVVMINNQYFKVRALTNDKGQSIKYCLPSTPVEALGANNIPEAGQKFTVVKNERIAKKIIEYSNQNNTQDFKNKRNIDSFDDLLKNTDGRIKVLNIIIKVDVHGSLEAIESILSKISNNDVKIKIAHSIVGSITESDVSLAKVTDSIILGFNVKADSKALRSAKVLGISIKHYSVIYHLIDDIKLMLNGLILPKTKKKVIGYAEIRNVIHTQKIGKIAGCMVIQGIIKNRAHVRLMRNNHTLYESQIAVLKRFKDNVKEVKAGFECGVSFEKLLDFKEKDKIEVYEMLLEQKKEII